MPADFETKLVELGRFDCEAHYRVSRRIVNRWLRETGKQRLIDARAAYVAQERAAGRWPTRSTPMVEKRISRAAMGATLANAFPAETESHPAVARLAAQHLRITRHGGLKVSPAMAGGWWVGLRRMTSAELVELAVSRGFDPEIASPPIQTPNPEGGRNERAA